MSVLRWSATTKELDRIKAIEEELSVIRLGSQSAIDTVLPEICSLLQTAMMFAYVPNDRGAGWGLERFHSSNYSNPSRLRSLFSRFLSDAPRRYAWYDVVRPEAEQRNRVLEPLDLIPAGEFDSSAIYTKFLVPVGLHQNRQLRVLLCEGDALLAWFGAFQPDPFNRHQHHLLGAMAPAIRRRISIERRLQGAPRNAAALEVALEQLGTPALLVGEAGQILEANEAAKGLLRACGAEVAAALRDVMKGRPAALCFEITPLEERGAPGHFLAVLRARDADGRVTTSVASASTRWLLTRRQRQVLKHIVDGWSNATIAAHLGIGSRAVELHVTALLDRAGVDSRSALVARVLTS